LIYAYAIGEPAAMGAEAQRGLDGAPVRVLAEDGLAVAFSRHRSVERRPSSDALWAHERVVEELMSHGAVLPLRFGTVLDGEDALRAALSARHDELSAGLGRIRGRVELGVRVVARPEEEPPPRAASGREYILARRTAQRRAERLAAEVHDPLASIAHDARVRRPPAGTAILTGAYLVDRRDVGEFRARVGRLAAGRDDVSIVCTGPWPPYSFVPEERP
jgi:Gas vesicle synthesis protein GvpL/GvpF